VPVFVVRYMFSIQHQEGTCSTNCAGGGVGRRGKGASRAHEALSLGVEIGNLAVSACRAALPLLCESSLKASKA